MDHSTFCGRRRELAALEQAWCRQNTNPHAAPELHVLVAESGLGKTRIIQRFYNWLSVNAEPSGGPDYWPDTLGKNGRSLQVTPPPETCNPDQPMPFVWLGLRCPDTSAHNSVRAGQVLQSEMTSLQMHLNVLQKQAKQRQHLVGKVTESALEIAALLAGAAAVVGEPIGVLKTSYDVFKIATRDGTDTEPDTAERAIAAVRAFFTATKRARVPLILVLDDIQVSTGENQLSKFVRQVVIDAHANSWPLLVIATSWHQEWYGEMHRKTGQFPLITVLQEAQALKHIHAENLIIHPIEPLRASEEEPLGLDPVITARFSGLPSEQRAQILTKVDGNPRYLEEVLLLLAAEQGLFANFDPTGPLAAGALERLRGLDLEGVVKERLLKAGIQIFAPLALAGLQGMTFYKPLVAEVFDRLPNKALQAISDDAFLQAETPFGFLANNRGDFAEFIQRVHQVVALDLMQNVTQPDQHALAVLKDLVREKVMDGAEREPAATLHICQLALELFREPEDIETAQILLRAWFQIGNEAAARYAFQDAIAAYDAAIDIREGLRSRLGDATPPAFLNDLAAAHMNKGVSLLSLQRLDEAKSCYETALAVWRNLADRYPQNKEFRARRDMAYSTLKSMDRFSPFIWTAAL